MYYTKGTIVICGIIIILVGDCLGGPRGWIIGIALGGAYLLAVRAITKRIKARTPRVKKACEEAHRLAEERYQSWRQAYEDYESFIAKSEELLQQDGVTAEQRAEIQKTLSELYMEWMDQRLSHQSMDSGDKEHIDEE